MQTSNPIFDTHASRLESEHVPYNGTMRHHYRLFSETKQQYGQILRQYQDALDQHLSELRKPFQCSLCDSLNNLSLSQWMSPLHAGCAYTAWQQTALQFIETEAAQTILDRLKAIETYKNTFSCHMCGMCCRMASHDAPYEVLRQRAEAGDEFARQFTSIFLPYASREAARQKAPEVVEAVLAEAGTEKPGEETIFFYHCPYLSEDNRCSVYGTDKRPAICASYPETPLSFVYEKCAWHPWKEETHLDTLAAHALLALCSQYSEKLRASLKLPEAE
jgi:Fe-S-cluster containining protein